MAAPSGESESFIARIPHHEAAAMKTSTTTRHPPIHFSTMAPPMARSSGEDTLSAGERPVTPSWILELTH
jgi:hypothetical protein